MKKTGTFFILVLVGMLAACTSQRRAIRQFEQALAELTATKPKTVEVIRLDTVAIPMVLVDSVLIREDCPERDSFTVADSLSGVTTTVKHERLPEGRRRYDVKTVVPADTVFLRDTLQVECPGVVSLPTGEGLPWWVGWAFGLVVLLVGWLVNRKKKSPA